VGREAEAEILMLDFKCSHCGTRFYVSAFAGQGCPVCVQKNEPWANGQRAGYLMTDQEAKALQDYRIARKELADKFGVKCCHC